jgi:SAM-dependent methyltransferase
MKRLRFRVRAWVKTYPWMMWISLVAAGTLLVATFAITSSRMILACSAFAFAAFSFVCGYVLHASRSFPDVSNFRRSEYAMVWDALSLTPKEAEIAAAGMSGEAALRNSGAEVAARIARAVSLTQKDDVLEIGCGVGRVGWAIAPLSRSWAGCDISANMLSRAQARLVSLSNVQLVHLSSSRLSEIPDESVDVVYCTNALPHFDPTERLQYVLEAHRVLRPSGRLYIDTVGLDSFDGWQMVSNNMAQRQLGAKPPYVPQPSTREELLAYVTRAGFGDAQVEQSDTLLSVIAVKNRATINSQDEDSIRDWLRV